MSFLDPQNVLRVPETSRAFEQVNLWLEEGIFGHRLWHRQTPWLLLIEFLNMAEALHRDGKLLTVVPPEQLLPHRRFWRMGLRSVLFNNPSMDRIEAEKLDNDESWDQWMKDMEGADAPPAEGFGYLRERFPTFAHFVQIVSLVRQTAIQTSEKNWMSRFIFPLGVDALYAHGEIKGGNLRQSRILLGRTGEILYMMLMRSASADQLRPHIENLLDRNNPKNAYVAQLCANSDSKVAIDFEGNSFLPYRSHPAFDRLASDWLSLFNLKLPELDVLEHLAPMATLHVLLYQLETAAAVVDRPRPSLVCEIIASRRDLVRQRAISSFQENDTLSQQAAEARLETIIDGPNWDRLIDDQSSEAEQIEILREYVKKAVGFDSESNAIIAPEKFKETVRVAAEQKHIENWSDVHKDYGRYIGLVSRRATNRYRYAPNDSLLKLLVITRVSKRIEFGKFLEDLYHHYGFVFGPTEAEKALNERDYDKSAFEKNRDRLEQRLMSMGLLKRLSDGCAYVVNPFEPTAAP